MERPEITLWTLDEARRHGAPEYVTDFMEDVVGAIDTSLPDLPKVRFCPELAVVTVQTRTHRFAVDPRPGLVGADIIASLRELEPLRRFRLRYGWSHADLATALNMDRGAVSMAFHRGAFSPAMRQRAHEALGVEVASDANA